MKTLICILCMLSWLTAKAQMTKNDSLFYKQAWKNVDSLYAKSLPVSAQEELTKILETARKNGANTQFVKALVHRMIHKKYRVRNIFPKLILEMESEIQKTDYPTKAILQSILTQMYWSYYDEYKWQLLRRTETINFKNDSIETWDLIHLVDRCIKLFHQSLSEAQKLQLIPIKEYKEILVLGTKPEILRPTLYDFLAHRAIDFFSDSKITVTCPADQFTLKEDFYFADTQTFAYQNIQSEDTLSLQFNAIRIFQDLLKFRLQSDNYPALIDADLKRLDFVRTYSTNPQKEELYLKALENLVRNYESKTDSVVEIKYQIAKFYFDAAKKYNPIDRETEKYKFYNKTCYELCNQLITTYPHTLFVELAYRLQEIITDKIFSFRYEKYVPLNRKSFINVSYQNIDTLYLKVTPVKGKEIKQVQTIVLPIDKDYNPHSIEIPIHELSLGKYFIFLSDNKEFSEKDDFNTEKQEIQVSDLYFINRTKSNGNIELTVLNRTTGEPLENVKVNANSRDYGMSTGKYLYYKDSFLTNKEGYVEIADCQGREIFFSIEKGNDTLNNGNSFYIDHYGDQKKTSKKILLFTDRSMYRPGQTVYFKGISLHDDGDSIQIIPNDKVYVLFRDVNYNVIESVDLVSNGYGTFSGSFRIPKGLLNGVMSIQTECGGKDISVEEYKRPQFEVEIYPFNGTYQLNDVVQVKGCAKAFSGAKLSNAKVNYRIMRCPIRTRRKNMFTNIGNGILTTNTNGEFTILFKALPDLSLKDNEYRHFVYQILVDVTDLNGETQSGSGSISLGKTAFKLDLKLNEAVDKTQKILKKVEIIARNLNNQSLAAKGTIQISKLKDEEGTLKERYWSIADKHLYTQSQWKEMFPSIVYDSVLIEKEKTVLNRTFNTAQKREIDLSVMKKWKSGRYLIEMESVDAFGSKISLKKQIVLFSSQDQTPAYTTTLYIENLTPTCEVGENAQFLVMTSKSELHVLLEIEHVDTIAQRKWLTLNKEQKIISIPVLEKYRGNFGVHFTLVNDGRLYSSNHLVKVPYTNKKLDIQFETFRNKLVPNEKEQWKITIKDRKGQKINTEMLATLYDASLDKFKPNSFAFDISKNYSPHLNWEDMPLNFDKTEQYCRYDIFRDDRHYNYFNWFGFPFYRYDTRCCIMASLDEPKKMVKEKEDTPTEEQNSDLGKVQIRKNFNETAFFYPHLESNSKGEITINFTIPESLTRWKMLGFAHTKDLKYGFIQNELVTQKDLMVVPNVPRFFRENDSIMFPVKITNLSDKNLNGIIQLELFDATTSKKVLNFDNQTFSINAGLNTVANWKFKVPENVGAITYRIKAKAGNFSDGEERIIPVLVNRMLVTESMPLPIRGHQTKTFELKKLIHSDTSNTLKHHKLSLEFTSQPAWYAIQSLPYLMEYPHECAEQLFSRFYANSLASHVANSSPKIKAVFDSWKNSPDSSALLSNLEKNQELKSAILEETPWVLDAQNESERKKRVGLLFDLNRMSQKLDKAFSKLQNMQKSNGSFPWFDGMADNRYLTQHIVAGIGKLEHLGVLHTAKNMQYKAIGYLDRCLKTEYDTLKQRNRLEQNNLNYTVIHYLYARSFSDYPITYEEIFKYYKTQCEKYWTSQGNYAQAMIALYLYRAGNKSVANDIIKSLKEHAQNSDEMGMYWENESGYYWYQAPIETQAMLIEAFDEIAKDSASVDNMRIWLLKQKQTQNWQTTKATTEAVYALLLKGTNWLASDKLVSINIGGKDFTPEKTEAGTGYFKTSWTGSDIKPEMGKITVSKSDAGIAWGALYWQYFEQLDKITPHESPLKLNKKLFVERINNRGNVIEPINEKTKLIVGDKVIVRIELRVDRTMEYVHLKDMRASGFEPLNVFSQYKYQDGLGYYECTKDAATNFFMDLLPKGTYVFEYPLRVTHSGDFSNGISTIQSMYAPEFSSHSEGIRVKVEK